MPTVIAISYSQFPSKSPADRVGGMKAYGYALTTQPVRALVHRQIDHRHGVGLLDAGADQLPDRSARLAQSDAERLVDVILIAGLICCLSSSPIIASSKGAIRLSVARAASRTPASPPPRRAR